jgi:hypothetical protein
MNRILSELEALLTEFRDVFLVRQLLVTETTGVAVDKAEFDAGLRNYLGSFTALVTRFDRIVAGTLREQREKERALFIMRSFSKELFRIYCYPGKTETGKE